MPDANTPSLDQDRAIAERLCVLALEAGAKALEIYQSDFAVEVKDDASPVTAADQLGEEIILKGLQESYAAIPVLAEESASEGKIPALGREFFLVDPLDGTKEFVKKTGEFTVNIALIRDGRPAIGVIVAPAIGKLYCGLADHGEAWRAVINEAGDAGGPERIESRVVPSENPVAVASRSHRSAETEQYLQEIGADNFVAAGSSLKFCLVAEGAADIYPRFGRTMEWDTGAGHAILAAVGGSVTAHPEGAPLGYGKAARGFDNPHFIAKGRSA